MTDVPPERDGVLAIPESPHFFFFDPQAQPAWRIPTRQPVRVDAVDGWVGLIRSEEDLVHLLPENETNACTGPIAIEGAKPGDTLAVHIDQVEPRTDHAVSGLMQGWGVLGDLLPAPRSRILPLVDGHLHVRDDLRFPIAPMIGTIGVAPVEAIATIVPGSHGGNMDIPEVGPGAVLYLPVEVDGALFGLGDAKALSGDGEVAAAAAEVPISAHLRFDVLSGVRLPSPVVRTSDRWITVGNEDTLRSATRSAVASMVTLLEHALDMAWTDAYHLCGLIGSLRISQVVNPRVTVTMHVRRDAIPVDLVSEGS
jgi:amidase